MKKYFAVYMMATLFVGFEYFTLSFLPQLSLLSYLQAHSYLAKDFNLSTAPGRPLSLWMGWAGLGLMVSMNVYSMRKRFGFMQTWGRLPDWLNFHIFCGLMGPTFIFFHCSLNVRGIVGISFWSMIVSLTSGIIGRYFYVQLLGKKAENERLADLALEKLTDSLKKRNIVVEPAQMEIVLAHGLQFVGGRQNNDDISPLSALMSSIIGDLRMSFSQVGIPAGWPQSAKMRILAYGINKRRAQFLLPYEKLMGYWHSFHFPFAVFMYIAAVIHVVSSLIFQI